MPSPGLPGQRFMMFESTNSREDYGDGGRMTRYCINILGPRKQLSILPSSSIMLERDTSLAEQPFNGESMVRQYRVPLSGNSYQWINRALVQATRKTAPPNGYRRKDDCLIAKSMLDLRVVSVEKNPHYFEFSVMTIAKFARAITTYGGASFSNEVGTCYCLQIRYLIVNGGQ